MSKDLETTDVDGIPVRAKMALDIWATNPFASNEEVAAEVGVAVRTVQRWRRDPKIVNHLVNDAKTLLNSHRGRLYQVALEKALAGDWKFMRIIFDHIEKLAELERDVITENTFVVQWKAFNNE